MIARGDSRALKRRVGGAQVFATVADPADLDAVARHVARVAAAEPGVDPEARLVQAPSDDGPGIVARLADALADDGIEVEDLGLRQPTLDDVFLTLTGAAHRRASRLWRWPRERRDRTAPGPQGQRRSATRGWSPGAGSCTCGASPRRSRTSPCSP